MSPRQSSGIGRGRRAAPRPLDGENTLGGSAGGEPAQGKASVSSGMFLERFSEDTLVELAAGLGGRSPGIAWAMLRVRILGQSLEHPGVSSARLLGASVVAM